MADEETATVAENADEPTQVDSPEAAPEAAPTEEAKAEPDAESEAAEAKTEEQEEKPAEKPKLSAEQKKIAKQERAYREIRRENKQLAKMLETQIETAARAKPEAKAPKIEDFESMDEYLDARDSFRDSAKEPEARQEPDYNPRDDLFDAGTEKYEDFEDVVFGGDVRISAGMADAIFEIDDMNLQADVAYFLGQNPRESAKIAKLSDRRQVAEIAKLEVKLSTKPATKKQASNAPAPIKPVGGSKTSTSEFVEGESMKDFLKKRYKQLGRT